MGEVELSSRYAAVSGDREGDSGEVWKKGTKCGVVAMLGGDQLLPRVVMGAAHGKRIRRDSERRKRQKCC